MSIPPKIPTCCWTRTGSVLLLVITPPPQLSTPLQPFPFLRSPDDVILGTVTRGGRNILLMATWCIYPQ